MRPSALSARVRAGVRPQVLFDFDRTLTSFQHNGRPTSSCHGTVEKSRFASAEWRRQTEALFAQYYPMEIATNLDRNEKLAAMIQWWQSAHDLMVQNRVNRAQLPVMVAESNLGLRRGARELLAELAAADVPVLIFSAGIADVITEFLRQQGCLYPNINVVSNRMRFDDAGDLVGFSSLLIHTLNKNAATLMQTGDGWTHDPNRTHVLLLGDNMGDIHMSDGLDISERLAVGFLNDRITENLPVYRSIFDTVILNDGSMELVRQLVQHIVSGAIPSAVLGGNVSQAAKLPSQATAEAAPEAVA